MPILPITDATLHTAAAQLRSGGLVAFPTETVYGLGGNACDAAAISRLYAAKGRPSSNPLIVHCHSIAQAQHYCIWTEAAEKLAAAFWPGPLTLVLERKPECALCSEVSAGGTTVAVRLPAHPLAHRLLVEADVPVAAPSANRSGRISPTTPQHVQASLGEAVDMILDGGPCTVGLESTVVDVSVMPPRILRPGSVTPAMIEQVLGEALSDHVSDSAVLRSPGLLASHYAPRLPVRLNVDIPLPTEALLAFGPEVPAHKEMMLNLSTTGDLEEAAHHLFDYLHQLDNAGSAAIAVMPIPEEGVGIAINDRLRRAAAPRA